MSVEPTSVPEAPAGDTSISDTSVSAPAPASIPDWRDAITDTEGRDFARSSPDPGHLVRRALDMRRQLSNAIVRPSKDAPPHEVAAYRRALDVPDSADGYELARPAHLDQAAFTSPAVQSVLNTFRDFLHRDTTVSKGDAAKLFDWYGRLEAASLQARAEIDRRNVQAAEAELRGRWGGAYDANIALANRAVDRLFGGKLDAIREVEDRSGGFVLDTPLFLEAFAAIGREMGEGNLGPSANDNAGGGVGEQIAALRGQQDEAKRSGDHKRANALYAKEQELIKKRDGGRG